MTLYRKKNAAILSVDVEDNFTKEELVISCDLTKYEKQVVVNTNRVVRHLKSIGAEATFFVVGKVAEKYPEIVKVIDEAGFEIGSHSYSHKPVYQMTRKEFEADLIKSISILREISGKEVKAYRAMAFSIARETMWALGVLLQNGIVYDSSLKDTEFYKMAKRGYVGRIDGHLKEGMTEFPVSTMNCFGRKVGISGGVAFRLMPYFFLKKFMTKPSLFGRPRCIYCHVWEFNKDQPKRRVGILQSIAQCPITFTTEKKIRKLSNDFRLLSISNYVKERGQKV